MSELCPECNEELRWLSGAPAHPDNLYCESCDYKAWEARQSVKSETLSKSKLIEAVEGMKRVTSDFNNSLEKGYIDGTNDTINDVIELIKGME